MLKVDYFVNKKNQILDSSEIQVWLQNYVPGPLRPYLSSALGIQFSDSLVLLGLKIEVVQLQPEKMSFEIRFHQHKTKNLQKLKVGHVALAIDYAIKLFLAQYLPERSFEIEMTFFNLQTQDFLGESLEVTINYNSEDIDFDLLQLQKFKRHILKPMVQIKGQRNGRNLLKTIAVEMTIKKMMHLTQKNDP